MPRPGGPGGPTGPGYPHIPYVSMSITGDLDRLNTTRYHQMGLTNPLVEKQFVIDVGTMSSKEES